MTYLGKYLTSYSLLNILVYFQSKHSSCNTWQNANMLPKFSFLCPPPFLNDCMVSHTHSCTGHVTGFEQWDVTKYEQKFEKHLLSRDFPLLKSLQPSGYHVNMTRQACWCTWDRRKEKWVFQCSLLRTTSPSQQVSWPGPMSRSGQVPQKIQHLWPAQFSNLQNLEVIKCCFKY